MELSPMQLRERGHLDRAGHEYRRGGRGADRRNLDAIFCRPENSARLCAAATDWRSHRDLYPVHRTQIVTLDEDLDLQ